MAPEAIRVGADGDGATCCGGGEAMPTAGAMTGDDRGGAGTEGCWGCVVTGSWGCDWTVGAGGGDGGDTTADDWAGGNGAGEDWASGDWAGEDHRVFTSATSTCRRSVLAGGLVAGAGGGSAGG
jgi:hypothetical protein